MKSYLLFPTLSLGMGLGLACAAASAQPPQPAESIQIPVSGQRIELPARPLRMRQADYTQYRGAYDLANGQTLYLTAQGQRMFAEVDDGGRSEIVGAAPGVFVALDRRMRMRFEALPSGDLGGELLLAAPARIAGQPVLYQTLALRR